MQFSDIRCCFDMFFKQYKKSKVLSFGSESFNKCFASEKAIFLLPLQRFESKLSEFTPTGPCWPSKPKRRTGRETERIFNEHNSESGTLVRESMVVALAVFARVTRRVCSSSRLLVNSASHSLGKECVERGDRTWL